MKRVVLIGLMFAVLSVPSMASAQMTTAERDSILAQISALLAMVQELQEQVMALRAESAERAEREEAEKPATEAVLGDIVCADGSYIWEVETNGTWGGLIPNFLTSDFAKTRSGYLERAYKSGEIERRGGLFLGTVKEREQFVGKKIEYLTYVFSTPPFTNHRGWLEFDFEDLILEETGSFRLPVCK